MTKKEKPCKTGIMDVFLLVFLLVTSFIFLLIMTKFYVDSLNNLHDSSLKGLFESLTKMEIDHMSTVEKTTAKHLTLLRDQAKESRTHIEKLEKMFLVPEEKQVKERKNDIAEKPNGEIPMTEDVRIPITDMTKIKFEDEETII